MGTGSVETKADTLPLAIYRYMPEKVYGNYIMKIEKSDVLFLLLFLNKEPLHRR